jgi:hypothetical protein
MLAPPKSHPDRSAATLANLPAAGAAIDAECAPPSAGAADCRIDLKLLQWRAQAAIARSPAARAHLGELAPERHPDVWAGTVQDGVARGFAVRLEECVALAPSAATTTAPPSLDAGARVTTGKELRKKKDLLVKSGGARVRFTRKEGLLFVDRDEGLHASNCLRFDARADRGTLDGFTADPAERPRLFSAQFLQPRRYVEADAGCELVVAGRLGRGPIGWDCELVLRGYAAEPFVRMTLRLEQRIVGWRLRARFLGVPSAAIAHDCMPVRELVPTDAGGFVAFTLVRACTTLLVDGAPVAAPAAACLGTIVHEFRLGSDNGA